MIERRKSISLDEFQTRYQLASRPVVLSHLVDQWPAMRRWTPQYLKTVIGDYPVQILDRRSTNPNYEGEYDSHRADVPFCDYVDRVLAHPESNDFYIHAQNQFINQTEAGQRLLADIPPCPLFDTERTIGNTFFWFGPAGTITPLHHDNDDIMFVQVFGRKRWTILSPQQKHLVYTNNGVFCGVDIEKPDLTKFPLTRFAHPITFVLNPGEALFLPVNWWHHVRALDISVSLSHTNFYPRSSLQDVA